MISRRNFFTISTLMFVIFFLCMFMNNLKDRWNEYEANPFITETAEDYPSKVSMYVPDGMKEEEYTAEQKAGGTGKGSRESSGRNRVVCISSGGKSLAETVREWVSYTKRDISIYESLSAYREDQEQAELPEMLVLDPDCVKWGMKEETDFLMQCVEKWTHLVFSSLPDVSVVRRNKAVRELLGIRRISASETTVEGIHLYGGFLLGGEVIYKAEEKEEEKYQDMDLTFPWYSLSSGTKVYMKGIPADESVEKEDYPVVIWRKSFGSAYVFAVNGDYMEGITGLGLLSAMSAEMYPYELYPVVNAQNLVLANYPGTADENRDEMEKYYARSMKLLDQELVWPDITSALRDYSFGITCMMTPQYDYSDQNLPDAEQFQYYLKIFHERSAEPGLSGLSVSDTPAGKKISEDERFMQEHVPDYRFSSFYAGDMKEAETEKVLEEEFLSSVRTVVMDYDEKDVRLIRYLSDYITVQRAVSDGLKYSYRSDFRVRSVETALGYLNLSCDMERVAYPEDEEDAWDECHKQFIRNVNVFGQSFEGFDGVTATGSDARIRNLLALNYTDSREGDTIYLKIEGAEDTSWFLFRNYGNEIKEVKGGDFRELEEGVYLIEARKSEVEIRLKPGDERFYY